MATGSHGTQPGPLWRGGDRRVTGARSEREAAKPERQGQDKLSICVPSGVRRWWRASGSSAVTVKIPREKLRPGRPPDIALPTPSPAEGTPLPERPPNPASSSSPTSQLNCWTRLLTRLPASTPAPPQNGPHLASRVTFKIKKQKQSPDCVSGLKLMTVFRGISG